MKKQTLFALGLAGALTLGLSSCEDDNDNVEPSLNIRELSSGSTGGAMTINQGEALIFTIDARSGDGDMETFRISNSGSNTINPIPTSTQGNDFPYDIARADQSTYRDTVVFAQAGLNLGVTNYSFSVTDDNGEVASLSFDVTVEAGTSALSAAQSFTWERVGGNAATGLSQFGLAWTSNSSTSAIVVTDAATKMVELSSGDWTGITTVEDLEAAIDGGTGVSEYRGVSSSQSNSYDDVLGVSHNGTAYMINIKQGTVSTGGAGTTITITGEYKN